MILSAQAGTMLHPAAQLRDAASTTPYLAAGRCGLPGSLASDAALGPSTTWVPPSDRLAFHLDHRHPAGQTLSDALNKLRLHQIGAASNHGIYLHRARVRQLFTQFHLMKLDRCPRYR